MSRILAIDYGMKRTGLAVTDPLRIIATALDTVETTNLLDYLKKYFQREDVEKVIIGLPKRLDNTDSETAPAVRRFIETFKLTFPGKIIQTVDERFTSAMAQQALIASGVKKKDRQVKGNVDKISAVIILQSYMQSQ